MAGSPYTRRRFLTAGAALAASSLVPRAFAQEGNFGMRIEPYVGYGQEDKEGIDEAEWYTGWVQDGTHQLHKVNLEKIDPEYRRQLVNYRNNEQPGTIIIDPQQHFLYLTREGDTAIRYGVGTGREGFGWSGQASIGRKAEWPDWVPPKEMRLRQPELPERMPGGPDNPLGARAMYLYDNGRDTLFRIHGTKEPWTIGTNVSSGCIRLLNEEVADLYLRAPVGTKVVVI